MGWLKKIFGGTPLSWRSLLILAVASGVLTGLLNCVPALEGTSFQVPAVTMEVWLFFGVFICVNCTKTLEAMAKTFVFFLVSQPLVYLVEVPFLADGWGLFRYYPYWFMWTLATIPLSAVAFQMKRGNLFAAVLAGLAAGAQVFMSVEHVGVFLGSMPNRLLIILFCWAFAVAVVLAVPKTNIGRILAAGVAAAMVAGLLVFQFTAQQGVTYIYQIDGGSTWTIVNDGGYPGTIEVRSGTFLTVTPNAQGRYEIVLQDEDGSMRTMVLSVSSNSVDFEAQ